jgi:hypothetical protein
MAADPGFEPGQTDSKSAVLPLHKSASKTQNAEGRGRTDMRVASQRFLRPSRLPVPPLRLDKPLERKTRFELATSSLARRHSTTELLPRKKCRGPESDWGHADFQSAALPAELPRRNELNYTNYAQ